MKNKTSLFLVIFVASLFIIPQITFAAWWNPVSWKIFNRKSEIKTKQIIIATSTPEVVAELKKTASSKTETSISSEKKQESVLPKTTGGGGAVIKGVSSGPRPVNPVASIMQTSSADIQRIKEEIKELEKQIEYAKSSINEKPQEVENQDQVKEAEKISKQQNSSSVALALTYEQRHCPRVVHIEDSLGNHSDGDRMDVTLSAPTTPKVITLRVEVKDPESRPIVFWWGTNFSSADLNQSIPTSSNTFNIDFSTRRIGYPANQVYIHFKNDHGYSCAGSFYNSDGEAIFSYMVYPQD